MRNKSLVIKPCDSITLCGINVRFQTVSPTQGQVAHALLTRPPLGIATSFDLNVLGTPPAFILSQDQTLEQIVFKPFPVSILVVELVWLFYFFEYVHESVIDSRISFLQRNSRFFRTKLFACTLISCCSIINDLCEVFLASRVLRDLFIISHSLRFVKGFLKSFLKTFSWFFRTGSLTRLAEVPDYYITSS